MAKKSETKIELSLCIKICGDPHCDAIFHNCPAEAKKCLDCGGKLIKINEKTYQSKFALNFFQYDYKVGNDEYYRPNVSLTNEGNNTESVEATNLKPGMIKSISFVDKIGDIPSKKYDVNAKYHKKIKTAIIFIPNND